MRISDWSSDVCSSDLPWFLNPEHRCLIPITAFAEAVGPQGKMTRAWISIADQPIAACAGLWRPSDEWGDCYTMVMVDAVEAMMEIHDRMPVILHPQDHDSWLRARSEEHTSELQSLMRSSYAVFCLKKKKISVY